GAQQRLVGGLAARAVGSGNCDREVVYDSAHARHLARPAQRFLNTHRLNAPPRWDRGRPALGAMSASPLPNSGRGATPSARRPRHVWRHSTASTGLVDHREGHTGRGVWPTAACYWLGLQRKIDFVVAELVGIAGPGATGAASSQRVVDPLPDGVGELGVGGQELHGLLLTLAQALLVEAV